MIPKQLQEFITQVQRFTEDSTLTWHAAEETSYFCEHKQHSLHITMGRDDDIERVWIKFVIITNLKRTPFSVNEEELGFQTMKNLYETVVVNANNVAEDIADFF